MKAVDSDKAEWWLALVVFLALGWLLHSCGIESTCYYGTQPGEQCEHHGI